MSKKQFQRQFMQICFAAYLFAVAGCTSTSAAGSSLNVDAQKAAEKYASKVLAKCGDSFYGRTSQLLEMKDLKIVATPEDPEIAADHKAMRERQGIDWFGSIHFECSAYRYYSYNQWGPWNQSPKRHCGYNSVKLVHQKDVWLYDTGMTLQQVMDTTQPLLCTEIPH